MEKSGNYLEVKNEFIVKAKVQLEDKRIFNFEPKPYILLMCNAFNFTAYISKLLVENNISIEEHWKLCGYLGYANKIYGLDQTDDTSYIWLAALIQEYGERADLFEVWYISEQSVSPTLTSKLREIKSKTRSFIGGWNRKVIYQGKIYVIEQHYVHCPELEELRFEYNLLHCCSKILEDDHRPVLSGQPATNEMMK